MFFDILSGLVSTTETRRIPVQSYTAHMDGTLHESVHVWCFAPGNLLVSQSLHEFNNAFPVAPGPSIIDHVLYHESAEQAVLRASEEQFGPGAGALLANLRKVCSATRGGRIGGFKDNEIVHVYSCRAVPRLETLVATGKCSRRAVLLPVAIAAGAVLARSGPDVLALDKDYVQYIRNLACLS